MHLSARTRTRTILAAASVDPGVFYSTLSAGMILARRYLTSRGCPQAFVDRYESAFGRVAAKVYREQHGTEPCRAWSEVNGKWRRVFGYLPEDRPVLDAAFGAYPKAAELAVAA